MIRTSNSKLGGWRTKIIGALSFPRRITLAVRRLWPGNRRWNRNSHGWEIVPLPSPPSFSSNPIVHTSPSPISPAPHDYVIYSDTFIYSGELSYATDGIWSNSMTQAVAVEPSRRHDFADVEKPFQKDATGTQKKRLTLGDIPFSVVARCAPSELPEDIERLIFELAAREDMDAALKTLVFVNYRIRKWVEYIIYESVILRDAKHARLFLDGLQLKHPDFAAGAVKILALPSRVSLDTSYKILGLCKNIQHLSWLPVNPLSTEIIDLVSNMPLFSLRARLSSFVGNDPDFSTALFQGLTTLFVADHQNVWKTWTWHGLRSTRPKLKWLAFNLEGRLQTRAGWAPVRTLEKLVLVPYGGESGIRLCICYSYHSGVPGDRWIHRSENTFSAERMAVLSLDNRLDDEEWEKRVNGERRDFEISEQLVRERQTEEKRLRFECECRIIHYQHPNI
ncbi:hypothetical protein BDN70DRAFT_110327 [Pholiota conissans]|uniref:Uncharacterized protein n=1 Tax=Pholiota conissans TaxID=109636 RepID=A0A9P5YZA4_9AGAR|nr:hypothetical protein BDN70DRAFT_110327 [Pholiota conissans]